MGQNSSRSEQLFQQARDVIAGGVNSPVRAFNGVSGTPRFIDHGEGPWLHDADGNRYIDYVGSWGPLILGHAHPAVVAAVQAQAARGLSFGAPTALETRLAELIRDLVPSIEKVRMVNSGTEAAMTAVRLARGVTSRNKVLKFAGCYHGHVDALLVKPGSGALTLGIPGSPGVPEAVTRDTLTAEYNNLDSVEAAFAEFPGEIACIMVEPVAGNMNCIPPQPGFLEGLRRLCDKHGALLVFDEVMTGFRVALGGAQARFGITPDVTALGKIVGGGMPVGAIGGKAEVMNQLAPDGPVYQAGTLSGNPMGMAAGIATLEQISAPGFHDALEATTRRLLDGIAGAAREHDIPLCVQQAGSMFGLFFTRQQAVTSFDAVAACDVERFRRFFHLMLEAGVYLAPSAFEAGFVSAAHGEAEIDATITAASNAFAQLAGS